MEKEGWVGTLEGEGISHLLRGGGRGKLPHPLFVFGKEEGEVS